MNRIFSASPKHVKPARATEPVVREPAAADAGAWMSRLALADRSCCCPARPVVIAVMPARPDRPHPVDLLLCGHHYRVSKDSLAAAGAVVYHAPPW